MAPHQGLSTRPRRVPAGGDSKTPKPSREPWSQEPERRVSAPGRPSRPLDGDGDSSASSVSSSSPAASETRGRYKPITTIDWRAELCRVLGEAPCISDAEILDKLDDAFRELRDARRRQHALDDGSQVAPRYQVLYRILCHKSRYEGAPMYENPPWVEKSGPNNAHLRGSSSISNLELHLERNKDIAFLVYADFECCNNAPIQLPMRLGDSYHAIGDDVVPMQTEESVTIVSDKMQHALQQLAHHALHDIPHPEFTASDSDGIPFPYLWWFHRRKEIDWAMARLDDESRLYMSVLQAYVGYRLQDEWREVDELLSKQRITAELLEYLYTPGQVVISKRHGSALAQLQGHQTTGWLRRDIKGTTISITSWTFDGSFTQVQESLELTLPQHAPSGGDFDIRDLVFYPEVFASDETVAALLRRGNMFWECRKQKYVSHRELAADGTQISVDSRFMVDMETYNYMHPREHQKERGRENIPDHVIVRTLDEAVMGEDEPDLGRAFYMCLPTGTFGFNMQKKEWVHLEMHYLESVQWNMEAFNYLVIDPMTKELIKAVVMNKLGGQANNDLISSKGNGLFMLLHGGPGTGKTLTAESVAEIAQKPLYRVTCGDVGTRAEDVETYLEVVLHLGKTWGCVVLLDEADVFLEQRSLLNLERNALVSVFLRVLEYYDGILILTSNRVGIFDEAFKSRIQLSLRYNNLGQEQRLQIWQNFILHLSNFQKSVEGQPIPQSRKMSLIGYGIDVEDLSSKLHDLSQVHLNGREIRNALSIARQLALHLGERLQYKHLRTVMDEAQKFDQYLKDLHGGFSGDDIQRDRGER